MNKLLKGVCIAFLLLFSAEQGIAQSFWHQKPKIKDIGYYAFDGGIGIMNYFGDLNPLTQYVSTDITATRPGFSIGIMRKMSSRLHVRAGLSWGRLTASDFKAADSQHPRHRYRYMRNAHFRNDIYELSVMGYYDLRKSEFVYYKRANATPYLVLGIAGFYHNPIAKTPEEFGNRWTALRPLRTEGQGLKRASDGTSYGKLYSNFQVAIPVGAGLKFKLNDRWDLWFDVSYRILFTDYIDDVSGNYANPNDLTSDLSRAMANRTVELTDAKTGKDRDERILEVNGVIADQRGNPTINGFGNDGDKRGEVNNVDIYIVTNIHLSYILNVGLKCPKFR
jgi:hypothetical protein